MRVKALLFGLVLVFGSLGVEPTLGQEQDEDVRGAFLTTRPKPADKRVGANANAKPNRRRPKAGQTKSTSGEAVTASVSTKDAPSSVTAQKLGLGLTLFSRDSIGLSVRTDPNRIFRKGDRVRVLLETNADGYLYIFNTTNGGKPVMIYPDKELDEGGNYIQSHVPFEIPSSTASEERLRWLVFDEVAGTERLYFVFSREPLKGIPLEDDLIAYCRAEKNQCPIQPGSELWTKIEKDVDAPLRVASTKRYGKAETPSEHEAVERGIRISNDEPAPSRIMMTASAKAGMLVTVLDLVHK